VAREFRVRIVTRGRDCAIRVADGALDLHGFERWPVRGPRRSPTGGRATPRMRCATRSRSGAVGPAGGAARLDELRITALERRLEADLACGRADRAAVELAALVLEHPLRELQMLALYRTGRQADALEAYRSATHRATSRPRAAARFRLTFITVPPSPDAAPCSVVAGRPSPSPLATGCKGVAR